MKSFKNFLLEKLSISQYREISKRIGTSYKDRYADWFDGKWRIYIPIDAHTKNDESGNVEISVEVYTVLNSAGYKIEDYILGIATDIKQRKVKIGKILTAQLKKNDDALHKSALKKFNERLKGTGVKETKGDLIVISRHPYDIAGMSTDRGWTSCKNLFDGSNRHYIPAEIKDGYLIAYQIKSDDLNIQNPRGRILIVPYFNQKDSNDTFLYATSRVYGSVSYKFRDVVQEWLDSVQGKKTGLYCVSQKGYQDRFDKFMVVATASNLNSKELFLTYLDKKYIKINPDDSYEYTGSLYIRDWKGENFPIKFSKIAGDVTIERCHSLKSFGPGVFGEEVDGNFDCRLNFLDSLEGAPEKVGGNFICMFNHLTSLEGAPEEVGGDFWCTYNNQLTSLEGAPKEVGRTFNCSSNKLTSLEGGPEKVSGVFDCSSNKLTSLEGGPEKVSGDFSCYDNQLTSLEGGPNKVGGTFDCSSNKLTSLEGAPKEVGRNFICDKDLPLTDEEILSKIKIGGRIIRR